jgi:diguanylate cyclase (GGDEF)-like protein
MKPPDQGAEPGFEPPEYRQSLFGDLVQYDSNRPLDEQPEAHLSPDALALKHAMEGWTATQRELDASKEQVDRQTDQLFVKDDEIANLKAELAEAKGDRKWELRDSLSTRKIIHSLVQERDELKSRVDTDSLTGAANRGVLYAKLGEVLASPESADSAGVLFMDFDGFKQVNDRLGHKVGDAVLLYGVRAIQEIVRDGDLVARLGGDELVVLLTDLDPAQRKELMADIMNRLQRDVPEWLLLTLELAQGERPELGNTPDELSRLRVRRGIDVRSLGFGLSIGATEVRRGDDPDSIIERADKKMYQDKYKRGGRR